MVPNVVGCTVQARDLYRDLHFNDQQQNPWRIVGKSAARCGPEFDRNGADLLPARKVRDGESGE
jgi:hypothetical protein